jgi:hypothetical protein
VAARDLKIAIGALTALLIALDPRVFKPVLIVGCVVYLPPAIYPWWRIRRTTQMGAITSLSASFPFVSSLLLGGVFAFPRVAGWVNGDFMIAVVRWIVAAKPPLAKDCTVADTGHQIVRREFAATQWLICVSRGFHTICPAILGLYFEPGYSFVRWVRPRRIGDSRAALLKLTGFVLPL